MQQLTDRHEGDAAPATSNTTSTEAIRDRRDNRDAGLANLLIRREFARSEARFTGAALTGWGAL